LKSFGITFNIYNESFETFISAVLKYSKAVESWKFYIIRMIKNKYKCIEYSIEI